MFGSDIPYAVIPDALFRPCQVLRRASGEFVNGKYADGVASTMAFQGAVMPVSEKDLQAGLPEGCSTNNTEKIYCNGFELLVGETVVTPEGKKYTVVSDLDHTYFTPVRRYFIQKAGSMQT